MKNIDGDPKAGSKVMANFSRYCGLGRQDLLFTE
jgi:hypothetical protein